MKKLKDMSYNTLQILDFFLWILVLYQTLFIIFLLNTPHKQFIIIPVVGLIFLFCAIRNTNRLGLEKERKEKIKIKKKEK